MNSSQIDYGKLRYDYAFENCREIPLGSLRVNLLCTAGKKQRWVQNPIKDLRWTQATVRKVLFKNFAIFTWNTCVGVWRPVTLLKKRPQHMCFPVNIAKFLKTAFLQNILVATSGWIFCERKLRLKAVIYFCKKLHLRYLTEFWIRLWKFNLEY